MDPPGTTMKTTWGIRSISENRALLLTKEKNSAGKDENATLENDN